MREREGGGERKAKIDREGWSEWGERERGGMRQIERKGERKSERGRERVREGETE